MKDKVMAADSSFAATTIQQAYNTWSDQYDTDNNRTRDLNVAVLRRQPFELAGKQVLEIGCGTGLNTGWLAQRAQAVVGMDFAAGMLARARQRVVADHVAWLRADITRPWPLSAGFDYVIATLVLEHVAALSFVFAQAYRVLKPGGLFYLSELHPFKQACGAQAKYSHVAAGEEAGEEAGEKVFVPAFYHPVSEYLNEAVAAGFRLRQCGEWRADGDTQFRLLTLLLQR